MVSPLGIKPEDIIPGPPDDAGSPEQQLEALREWASKMSNAMMDFLNLLDRSSADGVISDININGSVGIEGDNLEDLGVTTGKIADNAVSNIDISVETGSTKLAGVFTVVLDKTFDVPIDGTYKFSQVSNVTNLVGARRDFDVRTFQVNAITNLLPSATVELDTNSDSRDIIRIHGGDYTGWNTSYVDKLLLFDFDNGGSNPYHFYIVNDDTHGADSEFIYNWNYVSSGTTYTDIILLSLIHI